MNANGEYYSPSHLEESSLSELSIRQERLWFLHQLHPGFSNNLASTVTLCGPLDLRLLERSICDALRQYDVLRTTYPQIDGRPIMAFTAGDMPCLELCDLSILSRTEARSQVRRAESQAQVRFDLQTTPAIRLKLFRVADDEHVLVITAHRIACDATSMRLLHERWAALYRGEQPHTAGPEASFRHYAGEERRLFQRNAFASEISYWKATLGGSIGRLEFPVTRQKPPIHSFRGRTQAFTVRAHTYAALEDHATQAGLPLRTVLLACTTAAVHRWSRQDELTIGAIGRSQATGPLVGPLDNVIPVRSSLGPDSRFSDYLARTATTFREAQPHSRVPFEVLLEALGLDHDLTRPFGVQVLFEFTEQDVTLDLGSVMGHVKVVDPETCPVDLIIGFRELGDRLVGNITCDADLFSEDEVVRMIGHLETLMHGAAMRPGEPVHALPFMPPHERRRVVVEWNRTETPFPHDKCVHDLFQEQVERTPHTVAVVFEDQELTFRQLDLASTSLACRLQQLGAGPDVCIGVCMPRSLEMLVALYAVLKAGAAYVPMDPGYPSDRIAFMADDAGVAILIAPQELKDTLPQTTARLVFANGVAQVKEDSAATREQLARTVAPENLAYVIYTSGSSGKPKGVMVRHRNVVNFFTGMDQAIGRGPGVWLAVTSISFDISVLELFWTLTRGFKVVLQGEDRPGVRADLPRKPGDYSIAAQITRHGVTHLQCTPSLAAMMTEDPRTMEAFRQLKQLMLGGEALPRNVVQRLAGCGAIYNMYGPTETTVWSAVQRIQPDEPVSIGRPIANTQIYIVDEHLEPVPVGVAGELLIGGAGVVRGYLNRPELTAERFVPDKFQPAPDARLYRTGDLARYNADGTIEFLGRLDFQVKLRGFRIELGEIEAVLKSHESIKDAVVTVWNAGPDDKRLIGYVVCHPGRELDSKELRRFARTKLPDYMAPSIYMRLEALPLTPNGKIDRKALPLPEKGAGPEQHHPPQTESERLVAEVWSEVLGLEQLGQEDKFFAIGGTMRLALAAHWELCKRLRAPVPLLPLLQSSTVAGWAKIIDAEAEGGVRSTAMPQMLLLSAGDGPSLEALTQDMLQQLCDGHCFGEVAHACCQAQHVKAARRVVICGDARTAVNALQTLDPDRVFTGGATDVPNVIFDFQHQSQMPARASARLYNRFETFRHAIDVCAGVMREPELRDLLHHSSTLSLEDSPPPSHTAAQTAFALEFALARWLMSLGVRPACLVGRGIGQCAAASVAGMFRLTDALRLLREGQPPDLVREARIPVFSASTGQLLTPAEVRSPEFWSEALRTGAARAPQVLTDAGVSTVEITAAPDLADMFTRLAQLWIQGVEVDWAALDTMGQSFPAPRPINVPAASPVELGLRSEVVSPSADAAKNSRSPAATPVQQKHPAPAPSPPPQPRELPLTEAQREIWYACQISDAMSCSFNQSASVRLKGAVDVPRLRQAVESLVAEHDALRVSFAKDGTGQRIGPQVPLDFLTLDLSTQAPAQRDESVQTQMRRVVETPFDLENGPMFRLCLLKLQQGEHLLFVSAHHLVCDGTALAILINELGRYYSADTEPDEPAMQFSQFVAQEEQARTSAARAAAEQFWLDKFSTPIAPLDLPLDHHRPEQRTFAGRSARRSVPAGVIQDLKKLSAQQRSTSFTTLLAAFYLLLHRLTGQQDLIVGVPMTNRYGKGSDRLIGHCANFLPLRHAIDPNSTFREHIGSVRRLLLDAHEHHNFTLGALLQKLRVKRGTGRLPLVSVMFTADAADLTNSWSIPVEIEPNPYCYCRFDFTIGVSEHDGELKLDSHYSAELFSPGTINRWLAAYAALLATVTRNADERMANIAIEELPSRVTGPFFANPDATLFQQFPELVRLPHSDLSVLRAYVLDERREVCPIGAPGQVWLSGPSSLMRSVFADLVADPHGNGEMRLMYSNGLHGRYADRGAIELSMATDPVSSAEPQALEKRPANKDGDAGTDLEQRLVNIWRQVLAVDEISADDDFFELGGHSVLLVQVVTRVRKEFGVEVTLRELFEAPTIRDLARRLADRLGGPAPRTPENRPPNLRVLDEVTQ